jgi:nucleoside-diphosphate-sugar epimerase
LNRHRVFLAGAAGAVGRRLAPLLVGAGYEVFGTTRSKEKAAALAAQAVTPITVDAFDAPALAAAMTAVRPATVIHQLTDLPPGLDPGRLAEALARNARIRSEGTRNLVAAALTAGARRLVAQSITWAYAAGPRPYAEDAPLDLDATGTRAITVRGVATLERLALGSPPLEGIVLRYGQLYGPGTGREAPAGDAPLHVDAAAHAALLAIECPGLGVFNVAEDSGFVSIARARRELGWDPAFRLERGSAA